MSLALHALCSSYVRPGRAALRAYVAGWIGNRVSPAESAFSACRRTSASDRNFGGAGVGTGLDYKGLGRLRKPGEAT